MAQHSDPREVGALTAPKLKSVDECRAIVNANKEKLHQIEVNGNEQNRQELTLREAKDLSNSTKVALGTLPTKISDAVSKLKYQAREAADSRFRMEKDLKDVEGDCERLHNQIQSVQEQNADLEKGISESNAKSGQLEAEAKQYRAQVEKAVAEKRHPVEPVEAGARRIRFLTTYGDLKGKLVALSARYNAMLDVKDKEAGFAQFDDEKQVQQSVIGSWEGAPAFPGKGAAAGVGDRVVVLTDAGRVDVLGVIEAVGPRAVGGLQVPDGCVLVVSPQDRKVIGAKECVHRLDGEVVSIVSELGKLQDWLLRAERAPGSADGWVSELGGEGTTFQALMEGAQKEWETLQDTYCKLRAEIKQVVEYRAVAKQDIETIMQDQQKMMKWARDHLDKLSKARASLGRSPEDMRAMCESLGKNRAAAESNFASLLENAQQHLPDPLIENAMKDLATVWRQLQVEMYEETLNLAIFEHKESGMAEQLKQYQDFGKDNVKPFLDDAFELLSRQADDGRPGAAEALQKCKEVLNNYAPHQLIVEHLSEFEVRQDLLNDHYAHMRRTIDSDLTKLCQHLGSGQLGYKERRDYDRSVEGLRAWLTKTSQDPTKWGEAQQQLSRLQALAGAPGA